jgi:ribosomal protein L24E
MLPFFCNKAIEEGDGSCCLFLHYNGTIEEDDSSLSLLSCYSKTKIEEGDGNIVFFIATKKISLLQQDQNRR